MFGYIVVARVVVLLYKGLLMPSSFAKAVYSVFSY